MKKSIFLFIIILTLNSCFHNEKRKCKEPLSQYLKIEFIGNYKLDYNDYEEIIISDNILIDSICNELNNLKISNVISRTSGEYIISVYDDTGNRIIALNYRDKKHLFIGNYRNYKNEKLVTLLCTQLTNVSCVEIPNIKN